MTRRILAALLVVTAVLLAWIGIPLGMDGARHDRALFRLRATNAAQAYVSEVKWRRLTPDAEPLPPPARDGPHVPADDLALYAPDGTVVAAVGSPIPVRPEDLAAARQDQVLRGPDESTAGRLIVITPVANAHGLVAMVAMARPDTAVQDSIASRWTRIILGGVLAVLIALGLSLLLGRWVSRPLRRLERAAADLGAGQLSARAQQVGGPAQVRQLALTFDRMAARIESLVDGQRAFLADVSHQLRTPLAAMRLRLELLEADSEPPATAEISGTLVEVHRLSRMVDGLLAVARAEYAPQPRRRVDAAAVAADRTAVWQPVANAGKVALTCDVGPDAAAEITPGHLEQVLDNLLANALGAVGPGGHVAVRQEAAPPGTVRLTVTDDGPGMSPQQRAEAFRRFATMTGTGLRLAGPARQTASDGRDRPAAQAARAEQPGKKQPEKKDEKKERSAPHGRNDPSARGGRGETTAPAEPVRADRRGHGLGLAIVHALVTADGGRVELTEADGGGLRVVIDLPAAGQALPRQPGAAPGAPGGQAGMARQPEGPAAAADRPVQQAGSRPATAGETGKAG